MPTTVTSEATQGTAPKPSRLFMTLAPRNAPPAFPRLNAAIFNVDASVGASFAVFNVRSCKPGTMPNAAAPQTNTVRTAKGLLLSVTLNRA